MAAPKLQRKRIASASNEGPAKKARKTSPSSDKVTSSRVTKKRITMKASGLNKNAVKKKGDDEDDPTEGQITMSGRANGINTNLRPIHQIEDIMDDIARNALLFGFGKALEYLHGHTLRVATMCSGTESPILALEMIKDALQLQDPECSLEYIHIFSVEIVAFKQAYLERNFHTSTIFRNVLEVARQESASTAYGADKAVPGLGEVDILVAGPACVDFSNLNRYRKDLDGARIQARATKPHQGTNDFDTDTNLNLEDEAADSSPPQKAQSGESGDTMRAVLEYADKNRPPIVLLENVASAPWERIQEAWNDIGYATKYTKVDTKHYYIPQTRQRIYMLCVDERSYTGAQEAAQGWGKLILDLRRPASSPADAFLLDDADSRLAEATTRLTKASPRERGTEVDWSKCEVRHLQFREDEKLGSARPITNWSRTGTSSMIDYANKQWTKVQVNRIKDCIDMTWLLAGREDYDPAFKPRYPDMSQNIDRHHTTGSWGLAGCVTPSGMIYSTTRGGPLVGHEALVLQGIPTDKLLLTRETESELRDLAGNAMSSSVVGVALVAAIISACEAIPKSAFQKLVIGEPESVAQAGQEGSLGPVENITFSSNGMARTFRFLCRAAQASAQFCACEGQTSTASRADDIVECKECLFLACSQCAGIPRHSYYKKHDRSRHSPSAFRQEIKQALPMRLKLSGRVGESFSVVEKHFNASTAKEKEDWCAFRSAVSLALYDEYRFKATKRFQFWTICYEGCYSRLELEMADGEAQWLLYATPDPMLPANANLRKTLEMPIARTALQSTSCFGGKWQLCVPRAFTFEINLEGCGSQVPSWKARLGLAQFIDEKVWSSWKVSVIENPALLELDVDGVYRLLPLCGTANSNLHVRESAASRERKYLFLDPQRVGEPKFDRFVIASDHRRLRYGDHRRIDVSIGIDMTGDQNWRPNNKAGVQSASCTAKGAWIDADISLMAVSDTTDTFQALEEPVAVSDVEAPGCRHANMVALRCTFEMPHEEADDRRPGTWRAGFLEGVWRIVDSANERQVYAALAWLTERVRILAGLYGEWHEILREPHGATCDVCTPTKPSMKWKRVQATKACVKIVPFEDAGEAGPYERKVKARPSPLTTRVRLSNGKGNLEVWINVVALAHRAVAKLVHSRFDPRREIKVTWKLDTAYNPDDAPFFAPLHINDNKTDTAERHVFEKAKEKSENEKTMLRLEQQRSLRWMIAQECENVGPFAEEEVEEFIMGPLGWRLLARAESLHRVRGGLLADKVGYGKTITTLALIDKQMKAKEKKANEVTLKNPFQIDEAKGYIPLHATLILVPYLLISQWQFEIEDFLGTDCKVCVIRTIRDIKKRTIADYQSADIILASHTIFTNDKYLQRMSWFAARPEPHKKVQSRALAAWLQEAEEKIKAHVEELKDHAKTRSLPKLDRILEARLRDAEADEQLLARIPSKRLKGAAYIKSKAKASKPTQEEEPAAEESAVEEPEQWPDDTFGLRNAKRCQDFVGPLLQMFCFARIVVDEYTYVSEKNLIPITYLKADIRWILSGTPDVDGFEGVKHAATLLGLNLGVDDDSHGIMKKQKTDAEIFSSFLKTQSPSWHKQRHEVAQAFLAKYARQNVAENNDIISHSSYKATKQHFAERAVYLELQTQLYGQDMLLVKGSGSIAENDHLIRLDEMITSSRSPEEALLKRCTVFEIQNADGNQQEIDALQMMIQTRQAEFGQHRDNFFIEMGKAAGMQHRCGDGDEEERYPKWLRLLKMNSYGDGKGTKAILDMIKDPQHKLGPPVIRKRDTKKQRKDLEKEVKELREQLDTLHKMTIQYIGRMRTLRFFTQLKLFQQWSCAISEREPLTAPCCEKEFDSLEDLRVLALCGHTMCTECLFSPRHRNTCAFDGCTGEALEFHAIDARDLLSRKPTVPGPRHFGTKIEDLVGLVNKIKQDKQEEQILLFVQFTDVIKVIDKAFTAAGITFSTITGAEGKALVEDRAMQDFKGRRTGPKKNDKKKTVLILNASGSCAAGHNLTNANHVIFVSPFHARNQHNFDQMYEQAIGRAKRYGQHKDVHVYHFICLNTIDVNTIEDAMGGKILMDANGKIDLKRGELTEKDKTQDWGTVKLRQHGAVVFEEGEEEEVEEEE